MKDRIERLERKMIYLEDDVFDLTVAEQRRKIRERDRKEFWTEFAAVAALGLCVGILEAIAGERR